MNEPHSELQSLSDEQLACQSQAGSMDAFEELVVRYERRIYAFVKQSCRGDADARDLTQATFVRAFRSIEKFDIRRSFAAWLFTVARHLCVDHYRAAPPRAGPIPEEADLNDPAELLAQHEERDGLWRLARRHLPDVQFQALWLRYAADLDIEEIARVLGKTRTHIKVLLFRARTSLGAQLKTAASKATEKAAKLTSANTHQCRSTFRVSCSTLQSSVASATGEHVLRITHHL